MPKYIISQTVQKLITKDLDADLDPHWKNGSNPDPDPGHFLKIY